MYFPNICCFYSYKEKEKYKSKYKKHVFRYKYMGIFSNVKNSHLSSYICHEENFTLISGMLLFRCKGNSGFERWFIGTKKKTFSKRFCWHEVTKLKLGITFN